MFNKSLSAVTLPAGTTLLGYELKQAVAQTSSAIVYEAYHSLLGTECLLYEFHVPEHVQRDAATGAWQIVPGHEAAAAQALNSFVENLRKLSSLSHPNILPVVNAVVLEELGIYCGIVPSLPPCPKPANADALKKLLVQSIDAISYLQKMGHAPQCVTQHSLGSVDGTVRLNVFDNLMSQGQIPQTLYPGYAPIEYVQPGSATVGASSVLYSLAAAVYTLLTGQVPVAAAQRIAKVDPYQSLSIRPELTKLYPEALLSTIDKALSMWPEDRWASGAVWLQAIHESSVVSAAPVITAVQESASPVSRLSAPLAPRPTVHTVSPVCCSLPLTVESLVSAIKAADVSSVKSMLAQGMEPSSIVNEVSGTTALHLAVECKALGCVQALLIAGANVDAVAKDNGQTPLIQAAAAGQLNMVNMLIDGGAELEICDKFGYFALYRAAAQGHHECVLALMEAGASPNFKHGDTLMTPLMIAAERGHVECVKTLIGGGAYVDVRSKEGKKAKEYASTSAVKSCFGFFACHPATTIMGRMEYVYCTETMDEFVKKGANPDNRDSVTDLTPLMDSVSRGDDETKIRYIKRLRAHGADVRTTNKAGKTVEHFIREKEKNVNHRQKLLDALTEPVEALTVLAAVKFNDMEALCRLLAQGLSPDKPRGSSGGSPLNIALGTGRTQCAEALLQAGANVYVANRCGITSLHCAAKKACSKLVTMLIEKGIPVNRRTKYGATPLHFAAPYNTPEVVQLLISSGADVNAQDTAGWTPLMCAVRGNTPEVVKLLIAAGADVNTQENKGWTALMLAAYVKNDYCKQILLAAGADASIKNNSGQTANSIKPMA